MSKHTPGPWKTAKTADEQLRKIRGADDRLICNMVEREADARLIAAAPELLEALQEIVEAQKGGYLGWSHIDAASAAIAKAVSSR